MVSVGRRGEKALSGRAVCRQPAGWMDDADETGWSDRRGPRRVSLVQRACKQGLNGVFGYMRRFPLRDLVVAVHRR